MDWETLAILVSLSLAVLVGAGTLLLLFRLIRETRERGAMYTSTAPRRMAGAGRADMPGETPAMAREPPLRALGATASTQPGEGGVPTGGIEGEIRELARRLRLEEITLATPDGLPIASTTGDAQADAAKYSHLYSKGVTRAGSDIFIFSVQTGNQMVVGIVKSKGGMNAVTLGDISNNISKILNRWL